MTLRRFEEALRGKDVIGDILVKPLAPTPSDPGLARLMEDEINPVEEPNQVRSQEIGLKKPEPRAGAEAKQVGLLPNSGVEIDECIQANDLVSFIEEPFAQVRPDKPGGAGYERSRRVRHLLPLARILAAATATSSSDIERMHRRSSLI